MSAFKTILRLASRTLEVLAFACALPAAVFGYLAWVEAKASSPDIGALVGNTKEMVRLYTLSLELEVEGREYQRAQLATLDRILPEVEKARFGVERLTQMNERRLAYARAELQRLAKVKALATAIEPANESAPTASVLGWLERSRVVDANSEGNRKSKEILGTVQPQK